MSDKKQKNILTKNETFSIKLKKKHPKHKMLLNAVEISGYKFKNYELPKGTDLNAAEVVAWFEIQDAVKEPKKDKSSEAQK
jgi:hypothetical protein